MPGSIATADHKGCVYNPRLFDIYSDQQDSDPNDTKDLKPNEAKDIECGELERKVNKNGQW